MQEVQGGYPPPLLPFTWSREKETSNHALDKFRTGLWFCGQGSGDDHAWAYLAQQKVQPWRVKPHPHAGTRQYASPSVGDHVIEAGSVQRPQGEGRMQQVRLSPLWERTDDASIP